METMVLGLIATTMQLIQEIDPAIAAANIVVKAISTLEAIVPIVAKGAPELVAVVKEAIAGFRQNGAVTADQLAQLDAMDAQFDAELDADNAKAEAEERAIAASNGPANS